MQLIKILQNLKYSFCSRRGETGVFRQEGPFRGQLRQGGQRSAQCRAGGQRKRRDNQERSSTGYHHSSASFSFR